MTELLKPSRAVYCGNCGRPTGQFRHETLEPESVRSFCTDCENLPSLSSNGGRVNVQSNPHVTSDREDDGYYYEEEEYDDCECASCRYDRGDIDHDEYQRLTS